MAKNPKTDKPAISAAPVVIASDAVPAKDIKSAAKTKLSEKDDKPVTREQDTKFQKIMAAIIAEANDPDAQANEELYKWITLERIHRSEQDLKDASDDITYPLMTEDDIFAKGELSDKDVERADNRRANVANMRVLRLKEKDGRHHYLTGDKLEDYLTHHKKHDGQLMTLGEAQRDLYRSQFSQANIKVDLSGPTALNPQLADRMRRDPKVAHYVELTMEAAKRNGLDGTMLANQFWQESRFNPNAKSGAGAMGIAQIMPFHEGKLSGLNSKSDFYDAEHSIEAGAQLMGQLSRKYGDQRLALVAYNGGGKAIDFVADKTGTKNVSFETWQSFMEDRRSQLGTANRGAWHNETLDYTKKIALTGPSPQPA